MVSTGVVKSNRNSMLETVSATFPYPDNRLTAKKYSPARHTWAAMNSQPVTEVKNALSSLW